jgi:hypothetical protein
MAGFTGLCIVAAFALPPVPQPIEYHDFADQRGAFGVPHFLNVASNAGFLVAGIAGLAVAGRRRTAFERGRERWPWAVLFVGVGLTAAGSAYYHLAPDNDRLFWDRLPMTIAFMALVASQIVDRISVRLGLALLDPMLLLGAWTVVYWRATESVGAGNVLPYAILQGYAVLVLLLLARLYPSRYTHGGDLYFVFAWYALSKVLEALDAPVFSLGQIVSGHTLKHLAAAAAGGVACSMLVRRVLRARGAPAGAQADQVADQILETCTRRGGTS